MDKNSKHKKQFNKPTIKISEFADTRETVLHNLNTSPEWVKSLSKNPIPHIIKKGKPGDVFLLLITQSQ